MIGLTDLAFRELSIYKNLLASLNEKLFSELKSLVTLRFEFNRISEIHLLSFWVSNPQF